MADAPTRAPAERPAAALRLLIVDDELLARMRLRALLESPSSSNSAESEPVPLLAEAADVDTALALLREQDFDALLLDIVMPGGDGLLLAAALKQLPRAPAVVFVSAHAEHALAAFDVDAVDYLTKPVRRDRLAEALRRVRERRTAREAAPGAPGTLVVTERGRVLRLPLAEVLYLRAGQKYVTVRTAAHHYVVDEPLTELEQRLGAGFLRIHRNAVVARHAIRALELRDAVLTDDAVADAAGEGWALRVAPTGEWLAVSRRQVAAVRDAVLVS